MSAETTDPDDRRRSRAVFLVAVAFHAALLFYFARGGPFFTDEPLDQYDYALHVYQVERAIRGYDATGHLWSYDPFVLAGQPANVYEDTTNKGVELWALAAHRLGMSPWRAFNAYVLLLHLSVPFVGLAAARLFGFSRRASSLGALFWVVLWYFDSFLHWCWHVGMIAWGFSSAFIVLVVALMYRALRDGRTRTYVLLGAAAALVTLIHPFAPVTLALPLAALYVRSFSKLRPREHALLAAGTIAAALTTLTWIGPAWRFRHDMGQVDAFLWPTASYLFFDWMDLLKDVLMTGQPVRTAFRVLVLITAGWGLLRFRADRDDRTLPFVIVVFGSFLLSYFSGYSVALRQTQPYRNIGPAELAAALVAANVLSAALSGVDFRSWPRDGRIAFALGTVLVAPALARSMLQFLPTLVPDRQTARTALRPGPRIGESNDELPPPLLGYEGPKPGYAEVASLLETRFGQTGRIVVLDWVLGEYLGAFSNVPVLGGIPQRNVPQVDAHPLRHDFRPRAANDDPLRRYFEEYAVSAVVASGPRGLIDARDDLLSPVTEIGEWRIYRTRTLPSYFATGAGRLARQELNLIAVEDATPGDIVLRFHYLESLRCRPGCTVGRARASDDSAGFIRIADAPPAFEIYNSY